MHMGTVRAIYLRKAILVLRAQTLKFHLKQATPTALYIPYIFFSLKEVFCDD